MSSARVRRILLLVVLVIAFYLPGTLANAAPSDHQGNANSNGHGQGQDSPDDHDNGFGNDEHGHGNHVGHGNSTGHGQGQDSLDDHDNGFGNDNPPTEDSEPDLDDSPEDPNQHGQGQDSPDDHDNGFGNDDSPTEDSEPDLDDSPEDPDQHGQGQDSPDDHDNGFGNDDSPTGDPPTGDPPTDNQPTDNQPTDNPPTDNPPTDDQPTGNPPTGNPPTGNPEPEPQPAPVAAPSDPGEWDQMMESSADLPDRSSPEDSPSAPTTGYLPVAEAVDDVPAPLSYEAGAPSDSDLEGPSAPMAPAEAESPNRPPVATPGQTVVFAGSATAIELGAFVMDADGDVLFVTSHSTPAHGTLTVTDGEALFTPEPGFFGTETLSFTACDASGACIDTTVSVFVPPVNDLLIATNDLEVLSKFMTGGGLGISQGELVADLVTESVTRLAVPIAGAVGVIGGSLLFGLHKIGRGFDISRVLLRRN